MHVRARQAMSREQIAGVARALTAQLALPATDAALAAAVEVSRTTTVRSERRTSRSRAQRIFAQQQAQRDD